VLVRVIDEQARHFYLKFGFNSRSGTGKRRRIRAEIVYFDLLCRSGGRFFWIDRGKHFIGATGTMQPN
jgi:hypothetical protein